MFDNLSSHKVKDFTGKEEFDLARCDMSTIISGKLLPMTQEVKMSGAPKTNLVLWACFLEVIETGLSVAQAEF